MNNIDKNVTTKMFLDQNKREVKLKAIAFTAGDALSDNSIPYTDFEIYCLLQVAMDYCIMDEEYEMCAAFREFLKTPFMKEVELKFDKYSEDWGRTKKLF